MSLQTMSVREFGRSTVSIFGLTFLFFSLIFTVTLGTLSVSLFDIGITALFFGFLSATIVSVIYIMFSIFMTMIGYLEGEIPQD